LFLVFFLFYYDSFLFSGIRVFQKKSFQTVMGEKKEHTTGFPKKK